MKKLVETDCATLVVRHRECPALDLQSNVGRDAQAGVGE